MNTRNSISISAHFSELLLMPVSKSEFDVFHENGIPAIESENFSKFSEKFEDSVAYAEFLDPFEHDHELILEVNGEIISSPKKYLAENVKVTVYPIVNVGKPRFSKYCLIERRFYKYSTWRFDLDSVFDPRKLSLDMTRYDVLGSFKESTIEPYYDGESFEFISDSGIKTSSTHLVDADGRWHSIG